MELKSNGFGFGATAYPIGEYGHSNGKTVSASQSIASAIDALAMPNITWSTIKFEAAGVTEDGKKITVYIGLETPIPDAKF